MLSKVIKSIADCPFLPIYYLAGIFNFNNQALSVCFDKHDASVMQELFNKYNTDKSELHDYHLGYEYFLSKELYDIKFSMLEIGIGSSDVSVPFNMGSSANIGASLYCWRELFQGATVYGADVDPKCMIEDYRISTHLCNQLSWKSLINLEHRLRKIQTSHFRLIIDDGYHSFGANRRTYLALSRLIKSDSVYIIEDVSPWMELAWKGFALLHRVNLSIAKFPRAKQPLLMIVINKG